MVRELSPEDLYRRCDPELFEFATTRDLEDPAGILGQPRAVAAVEFGVGIERPTGAGDRVEAIGHAAGHAFGAGPGNPSQNRHHETEPPEARRGRAM